MNSFHSASPEGERDTRGLIRLGLWSAAGLVALLLAFGWFYDFETAPDEIAERERLTRALEVEAARFKAEVQASLYRPSKTPLPQDYLPGDEVLLIDLDDGHVIAPRSAAGASLGAGVNAPPSQVLEGLREMARRDGPGIIVSEAGTARITVAVSAVHFSRLFQPLSGIPADRAAIVAIRPLTNTLVARLAGAAGLVDLSLAPIGKSDPGDRLLTIAVGDNSSGLTWSAPPRGKAAGLVAGRVIYTILVVGAGLLLRRSILGLAAREAQAATLAGHDLLSGLANRLLFTQLLDHEIARHQRQGAPFALMYLDLDRFKEINDRYGHDAGDKMIVAVTKRIAESLRASDRLGRFGGDEFAVLQVNVSEPHEAVALARRILESMHKPFDLGCHQVFAGVSIGIAMCPANGTDRQELMHLADIALYRAKNEGRNRYAFFEARMGDELRRRKSFEDELADAITNGQLSLDYQPLMNADGSQIVGVEALVRWPHPVHGIIPPDGFIGLAEDRGLIMPLGEWVLRRACEDARAWPGLKIAVNVSPIQFRHKEFVPNVLRILEETGFDPNYLELELTESVIIGDAEGAEIAMMTLRDKGIRLALDDFGTGYSSLIYLRRFAFDKIKIDRSFVQSIEATGESGIIVQSIIYLGRALGMTVTAEGVETHEHWRVLEAMGCHELQGYYFSRPVSASNISSMLDARSGIPVTSAA